MVVDFWYLLSAIIIIVISITILFDEYRRREIWYVYYFRDEFGKRIPVKKGPFTKKDAKSIAYVVDGKLKKS